jgi:hypothetical protein
MFLDPGWVKIRILEKHPGSATLEKGLTFFLWESSPLQKEKFFFFNSEANFILPGFGFGSPPVFALIRVQSGYTNICSLPLP